MHNTYYIYFLEKQFIQSDPSFSCVVSSSLSSSSSSSSSSPSSSPSLPPSLHLHICICHFIWLPSLSINNWFDFPCRSQTPKSSNNIQAASEHAKEMFGAINGPDNCPHNIPFNNHNVSVASAHFQEMYGDLGGDTGLRLTEDSEVYPQGTVSEAGNISVVCMQVLNISPSSILSSSWWHLRRQVHRCLLMPALEQ